MIKQFPLLLALVSTLSLSAQDLQTAAPHSNEASASLHKFSVTMTVGMGIFTKSCSESGRLSLGELGFQYKASPRFSFGLGTTGAIPNDPDNNEGTQQYDENAYVNECDVTGGGFNLGDNLMGNFTFHLPGKMPFFLQAGGGFAFRSGSPVYSAMAGYKQKIFAGLGIRAGIRYSGFVTKNDYASKACGVKAELGLGWSF